MGDCSMHNAYVYILYLRLMLRRSFITLEALQRVTVKLEATLTDKTLTCLSADVADPEPLMPPHLLYGWRISSLPHLKIKNDF